MKAIIYTILSLLVTSVLGQNVCDLSLTAANGSTNGRVEQNTVLLSVHEHISWTYKTTTDITLQIQNVKYINKASLSINISLYSDNSIIGYHTISTSDSNKLMSSGKIGQNRVLPRGRHTVRLQVTHIESVTVDLQINVVIAQFTTVTPETDHFLCPYVPSDNKLSNSDIIGIVSVLLVGTIGVCTIIASCIKYCRKRNKQGESTPLMGPNPESPTINQQTDVDINNHRRTDQPPLTI